MQILNSIEPSPNKGPSAEEVTNYELHGIQVNKCNGPSVEEITNYGPQPTLAFPEG